MSEVAINRVPVVADDDVLIGTHEAARVLQVGITTITRWIDTGLIPAYRTPGGHRRVLLNELMRFARDGSFPIRPAKDTKAAAPCVVIVDDEEDILATLTLMIKGISDEINVIPPPTRPISRKHKYKLR